MAIVRFESIHVTNSGALFQFIDEPWNIFLDANGNSATITNPLQTQDDKQFSLGAGGEVTVPLAADTVIRVQCSGVFNPNFFPGALPSDVRSHGSADNWGLGGSFTLEASNADRAYEVHYSIACLTRDVASVISRASALRFVSDAVKTLDKKVDISDEVALSLFLGKVGRHGYSVRSVQGNELVLDGPGDIHRFLKRLKPPERPKQKA